MGGFKHHRLSYDIEMMDSSTSRYRASLLLDLLVSGCNIVFSFTQIQRVENSLNPQGSMDPILVAILKIPSQLCEDFFINHDKDPY